MAASAAEGGTFALEMTKWFDTNYHYLVPEFGPGTEFSLASERLFDEVAQAGLAGHAVKAVLLGPLSFLWLGKEKTPGFDRFSLLGKLLPVLRKNPGPPQGPGRGVGADGRTHPGPGLAGGLEPGL